MKILRFREISLWLWLRLRERDLLLLLLLVLAALLIYRIGFHIPVPGFNEEAMEALRNSQGG